MNWYNNNVLVSFTELFALIFTYREQAILHSFSQARRTLPLRTRSKAPGLCRVLWPTHNAQGHMSHTSGLIFHSSRPFPDSEHIRQDLRSPSCRHLIVHWCDRHSRWLWGYSVSRLKTDTQYIHTAMKQHHHYSLLLDKIKLQYYSNFNITIQMNMKSSEKKSLLANIHDTYEIII